MAPKPSKIALIPSAKDLASLDATKVQMVLDTINREGDRELRYASLSMICGTIALCVALGVFSYLVIQGHDEAAGVVLGATIVSLLGKIFLARL